MERDSSLYSQGDGFLSSFDAGYSRVLRHHIKVKAVHLYSELALLEGVGLSVTENCNGITKFGNGKISPNQAAFSKNVGAGDGN